MTIDEAIARERQQAKEQRNHIGTWDDEYSKKCEVYAEEHEQLAEWLEELVMLRLDSCMIHMPERLHLVENGYNKAIDDFAEKAIKIVYESNNRDINPQPRDMVADIHYKLMDLAKLLKEQSK